VEWLGLSTVEALRFRFTDEAVNDGAPWRRVELRPKERIHMLRGRGVGLASWVILITSLGRILHLGGSIENPVPSFSFLCPAGAEIVGVSSSEGLIKDVQQRQIAPQVRMTRRHRSRPALARRATEMS